MAAQTAIVQQIAKHAINAFRASADSSAAPANNPIASTKPAWASAAIAFDAPYTSFAPATQRNAPYTTQPAPHTSRHRSRKTRKQSRLTTATIRAAVSRAVNQGTVNMPAELPTGKATSIDQPSSDRPSKTSAETPPP